MIIKRSFGLGAMFTGQEALGTGNFLSYHTTQF
jgi:hypothetical protein